jgi:N-glycosylase/DNA lyase
MPVYLDKTAYIDLPSGIDLAATFECGQAFRWKAAASGVYEGMAGDRRARIALTDKGISISPCGEVDFESFWRHYLDLDYDYEARAGELMLDDTLAPMAARCRGMRILNQPIWECLVSFILSSNNNVKRISGIVERLCACFGEDMGGYFAFPAAEALAQAHESAILTCGAGYRAAYVWAAAKAVAGGFDVERLPGMGYDAAKRELMKLDGIGEKVADCVLLYSCGYREAFPVDVWVRKAMTVYYPESGKSAKEMRAFSERKFGSLAGLAQQYLFYYERCLKKV